MSNATDELANWITRLNKLCADKDVEIECLRAALQRIADDYNPVGNYNPHIEIARRALGKTYLK